TFLIHSIQHCYRIFRSITVPMKLGLQFCIYYFGKNSLTDNSSWNNICLAEGR
ncbi:hypothetical protein X975_17091, partial [Stegodyphus mimosarum]